MNNYRKNNKLDLIKITSSTLAIKKKEVDNTVNDDLKKSWNQWLISGVISLLLSIFITFSFNTVNIMKQVVSEINNVSVAFIAMIIGSFSLYQALLGGKVLYALYKKDNLLKELNESWLGTIMLYLFQIIMNIILQILFQIIPNDFLICNNYLLSCIIAFVLIFAYMTYSIRILIEIRNLVLNLYNVFQIYNKIKILSEIEENKDK